MPENQIRLINRACECEVIYFLNDTNDAVINNRMIKYNIGINCGKSPIALLESLIFIKNPEGEVPPKISAHDELDNRGNVKQHWDYHGELDEESKSRLKKPLSDFMKSIERSLPKDYEFHEVGVSVAKTEIEKYDPKTKKRKGKEKYGNIEIKYRPKNVTGVKDKNPDYMIVINLHFSMKKGCLNLDHKSIKTGIEHFLGMAKALFTYADLDKSCEGNGFLPSGHELTAINLDKYRKAKTHEPKPALAFAKAHPPVAAPHLPDSPAGGAGRP